MKRKIIMDCDPGHDDAIALILAGAIDSPLEILAVTTVAGNQSVDKNTTNALNVLDIMGRQDIAVAKGPLTNVATALIREPRIAEHIESITLMGGGTFGNWTPTAEFNIWVDAEAAKRVFESGITINVFGLDVTHQVLADNHVIERFESINNPVAQFVVELLQFFKKTYKTHFNMDGGPIHDACTILYLLQPELFTMVPVNIDIEHQSPLTYGTMAVDLNHVTGKPANAYFATAVDVEEVWNLIDHKLRTYE
ncbi:nucleoside hydrolase [Staphylococcus aureus]|uniref:nucleoside hydrolase n=1 Tax=Staphylococcus aureus TaxID=1280 RepID=UPI0002507457|nr:nucleoside hydrolase [Staphylococcus aureus]EHT24580.1 pyrimidine-specific ribonucleoside hydrolase rihA [Staphylococcus aureus subsp. aureus CIG1057]SBD50066.1 Inosine-uridine preferring nucleoside hydrolase [Staphylococcus aureus]